MDVAVTGSSGFLGTALVGALRAGGHRVRRIVRNRPTSGDEVGWDPQAGTIDASGLAGIDAVVHLAGESIGGRRWTADQKRRIRESRTRGTALVAATVASLHPRPEVLLSASGMNYYGDRGDEEVTEAWPPGDGFLAEVCVAWEAAAQPAADAGVRTALLRTGLVLDARGGALARMLPLFKLGLGGRLGSGRQWWSWIALDDEIGAMVHLLTADVRGPVNLTAPEAVTNAELARTLGRVLHRPAVLPVPRLGPRLLLGGELAETLLFTSLRVRPEVLMRSGYAFRHPSLEPALRIAVAAS
ncbi:MAG: TIGR01777 family oxidoreductase [Actinomycetota bacterium]|nr:TIGR01777 family oxidoreductase [Actinomycetota bacterium]